MKSRESGSGTLYDDTYRPHQGLDNRTIPAAGARAAPEALDHPDDAQVENIRSQRFLGGLLRHYARRAA